MLMFFSLFVVIFLSSILCCVRPPYLYQQNKITINFHILSFMCYLFIYTSSVYYNACYPQYDILGTEDKVMDRINKSPT